MSIGTPARWRIRLCGTVQGVGFRPYVFRLAQAFGLQGFVRNDGSGVTIEIEGENIDFFREKLLLDLPKGARIDNIEIRSVPSRHDGGFKILSSAAAVTCARIGPDVAVCSECLDDLFNPKSRFYLYPFTTCASCGPRFTITQALPFDRNRTTMDAFGMCGACAKDYADPQNRRFHAQSLACPACGPRLSAKVTDIALAIQSGGIVALKGVGGFHLICDARQRDAVARLRHRKKREAKPLAVMVASSAALAKIALPDKIESQLVAHHAAPIVLMQGKPGLTPEIAPGLKRIGILLAHAPIHHLIFSQLAADAKPGEGDASLVFTSANRSGEPLLVDNDAAREYLADIADLIVTHDRPIVAPTDDSVMAVFAGAPAFLRRARGFTPDPIDLGDDGPSVIAYGAHQKTTIAVTRGREAFVSQHIGDLDGHEARRRHRETAHHLLRLLDIRPEAAACDLHPDFPSTRLAEESRLPLLRAQHHAAHIAAVAAEYCHDGPLLGVALDGFGYGDDGTAWGGELMMVSGARWRRLGHLAPLPLPGGDRAVREIWRMGLAAAVQAGRRLDDALIHRLCGDRKQAWGVAKLLRNSNMPQTTSLGRLFDAAAVILGLRQEQAEEAQAAMELEALCLTPKVLPGGYRLERNVLNFSPLLAHLLDSRPSQAEGADLFHGTIATGIADWIARAGQSVGVIRIALAGGCMTNRVLADELCRRVSACGLTPLLPRRAPANDGGLSLGQALLARRALMSGSLARERGELACVSPFRSE